MQIPIHFIHMTCGTIIVTSFKYKKRAIAEVVILCFISGTEETHQSNNMYTRHNNVVATLESIFHLLQS